MPAGQERCENHAERPGRRKTSPSGNRIRWTTLRQSSQQGRQQGRPNMRSAGRPRRARGGGRGWVVPRIPGSPARLVPAGPTPSEIWSPEIHPPSRFNRQDAGLGPPVTRIHAKMVPRDPGSSAAWSPGDHLHGCPGTGGPQRTRIRAQLVPGGPTSSETWLPGTHPPGARATRMLDLVLW